MKKRILAIILVVLLVILSACSSGGNNVSKAYDEAMNLMMQGKYTAASEKLSGITYYLDSFQLSRYCRAHAWAQEGKYDDAISEFSTLTGFRDASQCVAYFTARKAEDSADTPRSRAEAADLFDRDMINGFRDASARAAKIRSALYQDGANAEKAGNWTEAAAAFEALDNYQDSRTRWYYTAGRAFEADGENKAVSYAQAAVHFQNAGEYNDAADRTKKCLDTAYAKADEMIKAENFTGAREIYVTLDSLCDREKFAQLDEAIAAAHEKARQKRIAEADALLAQEKFDEARDIYLECDEPAMANEAMYLKAAWLDRNGEPERAAGVYMNIITYKDSREKHYLLGKALMESDPETASRILLADREYPGAEDDLYSIALKATEAENYPLSIAVYGEFEGTRDCSLRMMNDLYLYGRKLLEGNNPERAAEIFDRLKGVGSADLYANMARYAAAEALETKGQYTAAAKAFDSIAGYADAADRANECRYQDALGRKKQGRYKEAATIFSDLGSLKDSAEQRIDCLYLLAGQYAERSQWEDAITVYEGLGDYSESKSKCMECYRMLGWQQMEEGKAEEAYYSFVAAGDADAQAQAAFAAGEQCTAAMNLNRALKWYQLAPDLPETAERTEMVAQILLNVEEDSLSESYASVAVNSEKNQAVLYALALRSLERKDEETAMRQMKKAGDNADASERFQEMLRARVDALVAEEHFDDAIFLCSTYGDQEKVEQIQAMKAQKEEEEQRKAQEAEKAAHEARKQEAGALLEAGKYEEASALYTEIGEKELADSAMAKKAEAEEALRAEEEAARAQAEEAEREKLRAREEEAAALLDAGKFDEAIAIYEELGNQEMISESVYRKAAALDQPELYLQIPEYKDSRDKHYQAGIALLDSDPEKAFRILADDIDYADTQTVLYGLAGKESENGHFLLSSAIYEKLSAQPLDPQDPRPDCRMRSVQDMYRYGMQLKEQGDWETAAVIFDQLAGIGEAAEHSHESYYAIAGALEESGKYSQAAVAFEALDGYSDAVDRAKQCRYSAAKKQLDSGNYDSAEIAFVELRDFSDAAEMAKYCRYQKANSLFAAGKYEEAKGIYDNLGDYQNSGEMKLECAYQIAEQLLAGKQYTEAIVAYEAIGDYSDAAEKLKVCHSALGDQHVVQAESFLQEGSTKKAAEAYQSAYEEYRNASDAEKTDAAAMHVAECYQSMNDLDKALQWYRKTGETGKFRLTEIVEYAYQTEQYELAESIAIEAETEGAKAVLYQMAEKKLADGDEEVALRLFDEAGDYKDAAKRREDVLYLNAEKQIEAGNFAEAEMIANQLGGISYQKLVYLSAEKQLSQGNEEEALRLFAAAGDYSDAADKHNDILYQQAMALMANGDFVAAGELLDKIPDYKDAAEKKKEALYGLAVSTGAMDEDQDKVRDAQKTYVEDMMAAENYDAAIGVLLNMPQDKLVIDQLNTARYRKAEKLEAAENYDEAIETYMILGNYLDAQERIVMIRYHQAMLSKEATEYDRAIDYLNMIPDYKDSREQVLECTYLKAGKLAANGDQTGAVKIYQSIIDYRDVREILSGSDTVKEGMAEWRASLVPGSTVQLGTQGDNNIRWIVLDREGDYLLLLSADVLEQRSFDAGARVTWQHSSIRSYLNDKFLLKHFSKDVNDAVRLSAVNAETGTRSKASPGNNTEDKVFLLNEQEIERYKEFIEMYPCETNWWTRTPGTANNEIMVFKVKDSGPAYIAKDKLMSVKASQENAVRPALWIDVSMIID